jgi:hypothetical protein
MATTTSMTQECRALSLDQLSARLEPPHIQGTWDPARTRNAATLKRLAGALHNAGRIPV